MFDWNFHFVSWSEGGIYARWRILTRVCFVGGVAASKGAFGKDKNILLGSPWFLLQTKAANTTGDENGGPFMQPQVCVRKCRYKCWCEHVWVQVGKYRWECIFLHAPSETVAGQLWQAEHNLTKHKIKFQYMFHVDHEPENRRKNRRFRQNTLPPSDFTI